MVATTPGISPALHAQILAFGARLAIQGHRLRTGRHPPPALSIGSDNARWQGLDALRWSNGLAVAVPESYLDEHRRLAATEGLFVEDSSAVAVHAARQLADHTGATVVAIATVTGLKDPQPRAGDEPEATSLPGGRPPAQHLTRWRSVIP